MQKIKVLFYGSSSFSLSSLKALHNNKRLEVLKVITTKDKRVGRGAECKQNIVAKYAQNLNIPVIKVSSLLKDPFQIPLDTFKEADYAIVVSFGYIIPSEHLSQLPYKFINLHPSLLPKYRGPNPIGSSLINGNRLTGNTVMVLDEEQDHGPILSQEKLKISKSDVYEDLEQKLSESGAELLLKTLFEYHENKLKPREQNHSQATFTQMVKKEDGFITLKEPAREIYNKYRAYHTWPGIYTSLSHLESFAGIQTNVIDKSTIVKIKDIEISSKKKGEKNNELLINKIQLPNKPVIAWEDFLNGYGIKVKN